MDFPYHWRSENVVRILESEVYIGTLVSLMTTTKSYKNKRVVVRPKEEQIRFENAYQAIVDKEIWDLVQKLQENKIRPAPLEEPNIFAGLVVCEDCGKKMKLHRSRTMESHKNNFMCQTHSKRGKEFCTARYIKESTVKAIILDDLRRVLHLARNHEMLFSKYLNKKSSSEVQKEITRVTKELSTLRNRDEELRSLFKCLYEDNVLGKIQNEVFKALSQDYLEEQKQVQEAIHLKNSELEQLRSSAVKCGILHRESQAISGASGAKCRGSKSVC